MKKFLAIFLVLILLFSFAACNKDDDTNTDDTTTTENQVGEQTTDGEEDTTNKKPNRLETTTAAPFENPNITEPAALFKIVDVNNYTHKSADPNTTKSSGVTFIAKRYEIKNSSDNALPAKINTEGTEFVLNETLLKDFASNGWTVISKKDMNTAAEAGSETSVILKNSTGKTTKLVVTNKRIIFSSKAPHIESRRTPNVIPLPLFAMSIILFNCSDQLFATGHPKHSANVKTLT